MKFLLIFVICHMATAIEDRIVGGHDVDITQLPYMAILFYLQTEIPICTASIIHAEWVLTAGNCGHDANLVGVRVGSTYARHDGETFNALEFIVHPRYQKEKAWSNRHDIALVKIDGSIEPSPTVQKLPLPTEETYFHVRTNCMVSGYGLTHVTDVDREEERLRYLEVPIVTHFQCAHMSRYSTEYMICAGYSKIKAGICIGDSGAPLVCDGLVYGVGSIGVESCDNSPAAYVNVVNFLEWIRKYVNIYE